MIAIVRRVLDDLLAHAREESPRECCGLLIGRDELVAGSARARNLEQSSVRFQIDPHDHIAAMRAARSSGLEVIGFYHSHPRSRAYPSPTDVEESGYADAMHAIVGVNEDGEQEVRLFTIGASSIVELDFRVVAAEDESV